MDGACEDAARERSIERDPVAWVGSHIRGLPPMAGDHGAWLDRARSLWDERAPEWDAMAEASAAGEDRRADLRRVAEVIKLRPGARVLDAGCGTGQFAIAFAAMGCRVTGVDLAPAMIARARRHAAESGVEVDWREGDVTRVADPDAAYDAVHARVSLQFVADLAAALGELRRVLKPGGRLYASVPGALSPIYGRSWRRFLEPDIAANYVTPWELEALLTELGWTIIDGWGWHGPILGGETNPLSAAAVAGLDRRLQQAAATTWATIAE